MYELFILARLMYAPENGYRIAKIVNDAIGPWAKVSLGTLYPLLTRLEQAGMIHTAGPETQTLPSRRPSHTYEITPNGRRRFHQLMMDITSNQGDYQRVFYLKVSHMEFLQPKERLLLLNHYINYCETSLLSRQAEERDLLQVQSESGAISSESLAATLDLLQHQAQLWQVEANWAKRLREQLVAHIEDETTYNGNKAPAS